MIDQAWQLEHLAAVIDTQEREARQLRLRTVAWRVLVTRWLAGEDMRAEASAMLEGRIGPADVRTCRRCGCCDDHACIDEWDEACHWVEADLCSACVGAGVADADV